MILFEAVVNDHTGLGGPMGSERITRITHKFFTTREAAIEFLRAWVKTNQPHRYVAIPLRWSGTPIDLASVGLEIETHTIAALKRPTRRTG